MKLPRRKFLHLATGALAFPAVFRVANAQAYPTRTITMVVPYAAGGVTSVVGQVVAERMRKSLGQPIVIENVAGADGSIGVGRAARGRPDGCTIDVGDTGNHVLNGAFYSLQYDLLNDFVPVSPLFSVPMILFARKSLPAKELPELIAWLRGNPNKASVAVADVSLRLLAAFFGRATETQFILVPYRGFAPAYQDLAASQIDLMLGAPDQLSLIRGGSIKAYAVTSDTRLSLAPDIPTFAEMGLPALVFSRWSGLFAPKGTPKEIIGSLNAAAIDALADPMVRSRFVDLGLEIFPRERQTPEALGALVKADAEKWWPIIRELGIKPE
jgi:tripartite-type tricarboxylate transporter receptor subunit TctC